MHVFLYEHLIMSIVHTVFAICEIICGLTFNVLCSSFLFWPFHLRLLEGNVKVLQFPPRYLFALHYGAGTVAREGSGTMLMNNLVLINFKLKWREIENDYCQSKHA